MRREVHHASVRRQGVDGALTLVWGERCHATMMPMDDECFIADAMLGKLVKWLRVLGIDVAYDPSITNEQLLQCAEHEGRVLLTRNRRLANRRRPARRLFIESDYYHEQVRQVVQAFTLRGQTRVFSRCIRCNTLLRTVARQFVAGKVPS